MCLTNRGVLLTKPTLKDAVCQDQLQEVTLLLYSVSEATRTSVHFFLTAVSNGNITACFSSITPETNAAVCDLYH